mmetsp:Transcript_14172/g.35586  ORF Transcript_14172/g.35586 Transcript_14172/m.35586 type:complete len:109 (-) Transcript_14172:124-450(-)
MFVHPPHMGSQHLNFLTKVVDFPTICVRLPSFPITLTRISKKARPQAASPSGGTTLSRLSYLLNFPILTILHLCHTVSRPVSRRFVQWYLSPPRIVTPSLLSTTPILV